MIKGLKETWRPRIKGSPPKIQQQKTEREPERNSYKCSLNKIENEKLERVKESAQTQFLNEGERCSKYCFTLNKQKDLNNMILGLQMKKEPYKQKP